MTVVTTVVTTTGTRILPATGTTAMRTGATDRLGQLRGGISGGGGGAEDRTVRERHAGQVAKFWKSVCVVVRAVQVSLASPPFPPCSSEQIVVLPCHPPPSPPSLSSAEDESRALVALGDAKLVREVHRVQPALGLVPEQLERNRVGHANGSELEVCEVEGECDAARVVVRRRRRRRQAQEHTIAQHNTLVNTRVRTIEGDVLCDGDAVDGGDGALDRR
mmetsp:Transcript_25186/g.50508  ORF Transcript_25186/g.50508 Transcript_25186/m.50508 type:complete len:219 (-) Transcript_25186:467-1123(-)